MGISLLSPGHTCWKVSQAKQARFLVDADEYYRAFALAAEKAQQQIAITAWDIDGRITLLRDRPQETLRDFFLRLLEQKPALHIYILNWKYFVAYAKDREFLPSFDDPWHIHPRLHFVWDSCHPVGACHHQKVIVVDNTLAFVGGLDLTHERWDTPKHAPTEPERRDQDGERYKPFHDTTLMVQGPIAAELGELVRQRFLRCLSENDAADPCPKVVSAAGKSLWPESFPVDIQKVSLGICRTEPAYKDFREVREIEAMYCAMMQAAQRFVYIESQYFTSTRIMDCIRESLKRPEGPEWIVILPQKCTGWMEEISLGILRSRRIQELREADANHRLHVYYPHISGLREEEYLKLHSKLMIVDDRYLILGSANICNRSMAFDTECSLALESHPGDDIARAIGEFRLRLLSEHLNVPAAALREEEKRNEPLATLIARHQHLSRRLVEFNGEVSPLAEMLDIELTALDPLHPLI